MNNEQELRHAQLQAQMTVTLNEIRGKIAGEMINIYEEMESRPRLKGDKSLPSLAGDKRLHRDDSGSIILSAAMGVPGMSQIMNTVMDVGLELYGSRKSTFARPQDKKPLSIKQIATIREKNRQSVAILASLGEKLDLLDTYIASGYAKGVIVNGSLLPLEKEAEMALKAKDKPSTRHDNENRVVFKAPAFKAA